MTTINEIMAKTYERKLAAEVRAAALAEQTEKTVEAMMDQADDLAYFVMRLREVLAFVETPLQTISALIHTDAEVTLEQAEELIGEMTETADQVGPVLEAIADICGGPGEDDDLDEDDVDECDCCDDIRRAEATLAPTASEDAVKKFLNSILANVAAQSDRR
jgi:hypothetical protein